jgi:hypothetical protein
MGPIRKARTKVFTYKICLHCFQVNKRLRDYLWILYNYINMVTIIWLYNNYGNVTIILRSKSREGTACVSKYAKHVIRFVLVAYRKGTLYVEDVFDRNCAILWSKLCYMQGNCDSIFYQLQWFYWIDLIFNLSLILHSCFYFKYKVIIFTPWGRRKK